MADMRNNDKASTVTSKVIRQFFSDRFVDDRRRSEMASVTGYERFSDRARGVVARAKEEARRLNRNFIGDEDILLGLIGESEGIAATALMSLGIGIEAVRQGVTDTVDHGPQAPTGQIPFSPQAKKIFDLALREALQSGHNYIGTSHILLGLIREGQCNAVTVLTKLGADLSQVRQRTIQLLESQPDEESEAGRTRLSSSASTPLELSQTSGNPTEGTPAGKRDQEVNSLIVLVSPTFLLPNTPTLVKCR